MPNNPNPVTSIKRRKYLELLKVLPNMKQQTTQAYFTLALTFAAITIFGLFAINPTLQTISQLKKQLSDNELVLAKMIEKSNNLASLQLTYNSIQSDVPLLFAAVPKDPAAPTFLGQIQALATNNQVVVTSMQSLQVDLTKQKTPAADASYAFTLNVQGAYEQLVTFVADLSSFERIVTFENVNFASAQDEKGTKVVKVSIRGRAFFEPSL